MVNMNKRHWKLITVLLTLILILVYSSYDRFQAGTKPISIVYVRVVKVHDGDTLSIILNGKREKVRLIGMDAPELNQRPWGLKAKKYLGELLSISKWIVTLELDVERRDKYGRLLCYVWTPDKKMINLQMIKDGYAMLLTIPPNIKYVDELRKAQHEARQRKLGIWSSRGLKESPRDYREKHPAYR